MFIFEEAFDLIFQENFALTNASTNAFITNKAIAALKRTIWAASIARKFISIITFSLKYFPITANLLANIVWIESESRLTDTILAILNNFFCEVTTDTFKNSNLRNAKDIAT